MSQQRHGRRGSVFAVRVTDEERARLAALQAQGDGPRALGPWMVWAALRSGRIHQRACSAGETHAPQAAKGGRCPTRAPAEGMTEIALPPLNNERGHSAVDGA